MRISDWSSDMCSSDLFVGFGDRRRIVRQADAGRRLVILHHDRDAGVGRLQTVGNGILAVGQTREEDRAIVGCQTQPRELERRRLRSEEHTSELQSLMRISYAVFCLKKTNPNTQ